MTTAPFQLTRNAFGHLVLTDAQGQTFENVTPVRAFPVQAPHEGIALVCPDGREAAWIDSLHDLAGHTRELVENALAEREFMPEIQRIMRVSSFATPCTWHVSTDRGDTHFVLKGEEDIRRIGHASLLITDSHGIYFLIRDMAKLGRHSRKILDRFL
jgi:hypothetical protein